MDYLLAYRSLEERGANYLIEIAYGFEQKLWQESPPL